MSVPYTFATRTTPIPLAQLDGNFTYYDTAFSISGTAITFAGSITITNGTANGVAYLNGSKVLTTGSALTFDGTTLTNANTIKVQTASGTAPKFWIGQAATGAWSIGSPASADALVFVDEQFSSEKMRLTSTGLGIGTSSPTSKLTLGVGSFSAAGSQTTGMYTDPSLGLVVLSDAVYFASRSGGGKLTLDSSGNLGLGVTPSAWVTYKVIQNQNASLFSYANNAYLGANIYSDAGGAKYISAGYSSQLSLSNGGFQFFISPSGSAGAAMTQTQAMTLDASGRLVVGATSTAAKFQVSGASANTYMLIDNVAGGENYFAANVNNIFQTAGVERARIDSSGNFLVGTTSATIGGSAGIRSLPAGDGANLPIFAVSTTGSTSATAPLQVYAVGTGYRFYVSANGQISATVTTISAISDARFKENVRDLDAGLTEVMALKPRLYDWKEGKGADIKNARGFIAQEFEQVFPDLIDEWKDPAPEGEEPYKSVRQDLIPVLVKAIQEQQTIIESLKARLDAANL